jgi:TolB-like protein/cytochrome c-type biogenesis protein CcmH/NrfG
MSLFRELKRRNVIRVAIAYIVVAWLLLQLADIILGNIGAPEWVFKTIMLVLGLGFPVAILFAWAFEMTPEGIKKEKDVDRTQSITRTTGRKLDFTIITLLVLGLVYFIWESRFEADEEPDSTRQTTAGQAVPPASDTSDLSQPAASGPSPKSIAVLPFTTRSNVEDDKFFSDGMHDDLLTQLAKIGELKVISRTSVMEYRDTTKNLREIGTELGVASILEGAVQRAGKQVRINVQLIDATTDEHLWAEKYDREITTDNLFAIQSEIALAISEALQATLSPEEKQRLEQRNLTDNLEALKAYQRSRLLAENFDVDNLRRAESEARHALELDPQFAAAWAQLAQIQLAFYWHIEIKPEHLSAARDSIDKGRSIAPDLPELQIADGLYYYWGYRDYENALRVLAPVLETYPNNVDVNKLLGWINRRYGRFEDALEHMHKALTLEPRSVELAYSLSETYLLLRNPGSAKEYLKLLEAINSNHQRFYYQAGFMSYAVDGDPAAAARYWKHVVRDLPYDYWRALAAMDDYETFKEFDAFDTSQNIGEVVFTSAMMRGLTLRLAGDPDAAQPWLDESRLHYTKLLADRPDDFRLLKPLCVTDGARGDAAAAAISCLRALEQLPKDAYDRNYHRTEIAGGLALAGLNEQALDLLDEVMAEPAGPTRTELQLGADLRSLHGEPRWQKLMARPSG